MAQEFDPYYKWLGIPPRDQPPHHYRLLGIEVFENDRDVIDAAANRIMAYLKDLAAGDEAEYSQNLLNEVSRARICLLNKTKKTAYDEELRGKLRSPTVTDDQARKPGAKPPVKTFEGKTPSREPVAEEPAPLIRTTKQRPRPTAGAVVFSAPAASGDEKPATEFRWKLIAVVAAGAACVCLAVLIVVVAFLFLGRGDTEVVSANNVVPHADGLPPTDTVDFGPDSETDLGSSDPDADTNPEAEANTGSEADPEVDPMMESPPASKTDIAPGSEAATDDQSETEPPSATKPNSDSVPGKDTGLPVMPETSGDSSTADVSTDDATDNGVEKPKEEPTAVATADDKPDPTNVKPPADDAGMPEAEPPKTTALKEEPPVPKEPTKPAKPTRQPFQDLPKTVSLPDLEAADAMSPQAIGLVHVPPDDLCFIKLRGGEQACKGSEAFVMRNADGGLAERDWEILFRDGEAGPETNIAHLSIDDDSQLVFQWQPEAKNQASSANLCNCVLKFSAAGQSHVATLRESAKADGLTFEFDKPTSKDDWKIDMPPDPAGIKLEITGVGDATYTVQPDPVMEANRGEAWVDLEDGGGLLRLKVETEMKRNLVVEVTVTPHWKSPLDGKPQKFIAKQFRDTLNVRERELAQSPFVIQQMQQLANRASGREKTVRDQQVALAEQAQVTLQATVENAQKLLEFLQNAGGKLQIQFRLFYDADSSEVDLLHAGG